MDFKLGSDPELMLCDVESKALKSAIPVIEEGKGFGRDVGNGNSVLHDNVLVEFNTKPAKTEFQFVRTVTKALESISKLVAKENMQLMARASADFPEEELNCEEAKVFGCESDWSAWTLKKNSIPPEAEKAPFRSAGGHLHIGMPDTEGPLTKILHDDYGKVDVVKALDIFCGITSIFIDKDPTSAKRRQLYGGAGSHRPKTYGVEYRALGNWWVSSPLYTKLVYQLTSRALDIVVRGKLDKLIEDIGGQDKIISIINESKVKEARVVFSKHIKPLLLKKTYLLCKRADKYTLKDLSDEWKL
jgi:hypothetical protein